MYDLFKEYYNLQQKNIAQKIDKEYYYHQGSYNTSTNFIGLITLNYKDSFLSVYSKQDLKRLKVIGAQEHTKKVGVVESKSSQL